MPAIAQSPAVQLAAEFVVGTCYRSMDDISRVKSMAALMKWPVMSPEMTNMSKPVDALDYQGWYVQHEGQTFFVAVNRGKLRDKPLEVCSVVANHRAEEIVPIVIRGLRNARLADSRQDGFQVNELYRLDHPTQGEALLQVIKGVDKEPPVSFGFMASK